MSYRKKIVVTTAKDSVDNILVFYERNLKSGVDFIVIFLDDCDEEIVDAVRKKNVLVINSNDKFWHGRRPTNLNMRQKVHMNLVNFWLSLIGEDCWLFNIDLDEVLYIDETEICNLPVSTKYVQLSPLECLSIYGFDQEKAKKFYFKRLLTENEISLLYILGKIGQPHNRNFFKAHTQGKPGIIPSLDFHLDGHYIKSKDNMEAYESKTLAILHFDMPSEKEFRQKWLRSIDSNANAGHKVVRSHIKNAFSCLNENGSLSKEDKENLFNEIFINKIQDDFDFLEKLNLLVHVEFGEAREREDCIDISRKLSKMSQYFNGEKSQIFLLPRYEQRKTYARDYAISILESDPLWSFQILDTLLLYRPNGKTIIKYREKAKKLACEHL